MSNLKNKFTTLPSTTTNISCLQIKIKSFSFLHLLKLVMYLKRINSYLTFNFIGLPSKLKHIVILRSPFIYKSSRLKFTLEIVNGLIFFNFKIPNKKLKSLINFLLKKISKNSFFNIYFLKKITFGYRF